MSANLSLILLNPAFGVLFSAVFYILWRYDRKQRYVLLLSITYLCCAIGFIFQQVNLPLGPGPSRVLSNLAFILTGSLMATALSWRYGRPAPVVAIALLAVFGASFSVWFTLVVPNMEVRVYAMSTCLGGFLLLVASRIYGRARHSLDRGLMVVIGLNGVVMVVRIVLLIEMNANVSVESLNGSPAWVIFVFSHSLASLVIVTMLAIAVVKDHLGDLSMRVRTDPVTGLLNRRGFDEAVAEIALTPTIRLSVIVCDIDHFKQVNDLFGHHSGDGVIAEFGQLIAAVADGPHLKARIGGEEFVILLFGGDKSVARLVAQSIGGAFTRFVSPSGAGGENHPLTASFGIAQLMLGENIQSLLHRADAALYEAKRRGRDRTVAWGELEPQNDDAWTSVEVA